MEFLVWMEKKKNFSLFFFFLHHEYKLGKYLFKDIDWDVNLNELFAIQSQMWNEEMEYQSTINTHGFLFQDFRKENDAVSKTNKKFEKWREKKTAHKDSVGWYGIFVAIESNLIHKLVKLCEYFIAKRKKNGNISKTLMFVVRRWLWNACDEQFSFRYCWCWLENCQKWR